MVHHEIIVAKLAAADGLSGHLDVIADSSGFYIHDKGAGINCPPHKSLESAREAAQEKADDFDKCKLDTLKSQWNSDPCWDIEETEGFATFYNELKFYRLETERDSARIELHQLQSALSAFGAILREFQPQ